MPLTNETYAEDNVGNITYQYRINYDASQFITVYVYQDQAGRGKRIEEIYGVTEGDANAAGGHNLIVSDKETSIVYTSTGDKTDNYYDQVKNSALPACQTSTTCQQLGYCQAGCPYASGLLHGAWR